MQSLPGTGSNDIACTVSGQAINCGRCQKFGVRLPSLFLLASRGIPRIPISTRNVFLILNISPPSTRCDLILFVPKLGPRIHETISNDAVSNSCPRPTSIHQSIHTYLYLYLHRRNNELNAAANRRKWWGVLLITRGIDISHRIPQQIGLALIISTLYPSFISYPRTRRPSQILYPSNVYPAW